MIDALDRALIDLFTDDPDIGVLGASRSLGVARGTVQSRLAKLGDRGVITSWAPRIDPAGLGYAVTAFITLEISQGRGTHPVVDHLRTVPEVIEAHTITGGGDILCRVVARDNTDLQRVLNDILDDRYVVRSSTVIALSEPIAHRTGPLVETAVAAPPL